MSDNNSFPRSPAADTGHPPSAPPVSTPLAPAAAGDARSIFQLDTRAERSDWFATATGRLVYVMAPEKSDVHIADIALSLSRQCRFAGHMRANVAHYSVAQHSVLVSYACEPRHALLGLLHDATEAYTQDIVRPLKHALGASYKALEYAWAVRIGAEFGLGEALANLPSDVKHADNRLLATEKRDLLVPPPRPWTSLPEPIHEAIEPIDSFAACALFLERFRKLTGGAP